MYEANKKAGQKWKNGDYIMFVEDFNGLYFHTGDVYEILDINKSDISSYKVIHSKNNNPPIGLVSTVGEALFIFNIKKLNRKEKKKYENAYLANLI